MESDKKKTISSFLWVFSSNFSTFLIQFFLGIVLARILGPEAYGLIGMVLVITGFARIFLDFGFSEGLIQKENISKEDLSSIFWLNLIIGFSLTLIVFNCAAILAEFYNENRIINITKVMSSIFVLQSMALVQKSLLERNVEFRKLSIIQITSRLSSVVFALVLATNGLGVWSLVALHLSEILIYNLGLWYFSHWTPSLLFKSSSIKGLFSYSFALFLNGFMEVISSNIDKLLIGKYLGQIKLGLFVKANGIVRLPVSQIMQAISRVMFPTLSRIQNEDDKIRSIYRQAMVLVAFIITPTVGMIYFLFEELTLILFGVEWMNMVAVGKILCLGGIFLPFNILSDSVVKTKGVIFYLHLLTFSEKPLRIGLVILGVYLLGFEGVAWGFVFASIINFGLKSYVVHRLISFPVMTQIKSLFKSFLLAFLIYLLSELTSFESVSLMVGVILKASMLIILIGSYMILVQRNELLKIYGLLKSLAAR